MPLNHQHDLSLKSPGYVENLRVVRNESSPDDWSLAGDVSFDRGTLQEAMGGFSEYAASGCSRSASIGSWSPVTIRE